MTFVNGIDPNWITTSSELLPRGVHHLESDLDERSSLPIPCHASYYTYWEMREHDSDDHNEAKMGGEPRPTGSTNGVLTKSKHDETLL